MIQVLVECREINCPTQKEKEETAAKCLWLTFLRGPKRRQRLKRGSKWGRSKICAQQAPSVFSNRPFVATATFLGLSVTLRHHLYTSVTGAVLFILSVVPTLTLCFCFFSYCQVFKQPAGFIQPAEWSWWTRGSMDSMWPIWPKSFYVPPSLLFCFCLSVRKDHFIG